jgi:uncharacterized membrane protein YhiD involved in acid resistance|tara:strand:+ start:87 stop:770 length:684 start_codon:yes stop_codon:yes gene_type:complete
MNKNEIINLFQTGAVTSEYASNITVFGMLSILILSFLISLIINYTYRKAFFGVLYQRSFAITLTIITIVSSMITVVISGNLALSLGMVGALSIIRYRTAVKDPIDIAFLFWSVAVGIANGILAFKISIVSTVFICIVLLSMHRFSKNYGSKLLFIDLDKNSFDECMKKIQIISKNYKVVSNIINDQKQEIIIDIFNLKNENDVMKLISSTKGVNNCSIISKNSSSLD